MNLFYDPGAQSGLYELAADEAKHLIRVLRRRVGDQVRVVDGLGTTYDGHVQRIDRTSCTLDLRKSEEKATRSDYTITLALGPTKKSDRMEWLVEKATEIGFDKLQPVLCSHSERNKMRLDRLHRVAISAMKQSLQSHLPAIEPIVKFSEFLDRDTSDQKFIAYLGEDTDTTIKNLVHAYTPEAGQSVSLLIGPEGGFSADEADQAMAAGFVPVRLGPNRLRTETAALYALQCISMLQLSSQL
ncbi:MAG: RsmE family RNA methyltransferase [Bacteroidota bacterium]